MQIVIEIDLNKIWSFLIKNFFFEISILIQIIF